MRVGSWGDFASFYIEGERLLGAYRNYLLLFAQLWLDRPAGAEADPSDLAQEALLRAQQRFDQFHGQSEPELAAWLRRILARLIADLVRHRRANSRLAGKQESLEDLLSGSEQAMDSLMVASGTTPSAAAERKELGVILADALAAISPEHRRVIVLRSLQDRPWAEVADELQSSIGAVQTLWTRALKELRPHIEGRL